MEKHGDGTEHPHITKVTMNRLDKQRQNQVEDLECTISQKTKEYDNSDQSFLWTLYYFPHSPKDRDTVERALDGVKQI